MTIFGRGVGVESGALCRDFRFLMRPEKFNPRGEEISATGGGGRPIFNREERGKKLFSSSRIRLTSST